MRKFFVFLFDTTEKTTKYVESTAFTAGRAVESLHGIFNRGKKKKDKWVNWEERYILKSVVQTFIYPKPTLDPVTGKPFSLTQLAS